MFWWICFILCLFFGFAVALVPPKRKYMKLSENLMSVMLFFLGIVVLRIIYLIWYYLCFGAVVIECSHSFGDVVAYGLPTILGLAFILGLIIKFLK